MTGGAPDRRASHFQTGAGDYAGARPTYPPELAAALAALCPGRGLAVDVGCGSGQLTPSPADHFDAVAGVDVSPAQLVQAPAHPRIDWREGRAQALPVAIRFPLTVIAGRIA
ncbi:class I SAM-dependent methyltransferase [Paracoccus sp. (in: a-proteobacteria)]|uniref:class I SAM-dependent methyltransferase n=1 Tax=Paracoccus sp. TaxID=267 RepID=UPI0026DEFEA0|nr:class I SAM-dependent methyltransferase [Paracoccus sp. (in: a-proteobacteria)]MDO5369227.1 class I SAM-dependent methyltransferase [Paracoccus sp. (in: a-proteobacteria)]